MNNKHRFLNNTSKKETIVYATGSRPHGFAIRDGLADNLQRPYFTDLVKAGVMDPVLVTISALVNAASVCGLLLTTNGRHGRHDVAA